MNVRDLFELCSKFCVNIVPRVLEIWLFLYKRFTKVKTEKMQCLGGVFMFLNVSVYASVSRIVKNVWAIVDRSNSREKCSLYQHSLCFMKVNKTNESKKEANSNLR